MWYYNTKKRKEKNDRGLSGKLAGHEPFAHVRERTSESESEKSETNNTERVRLCQGAVLFVRADPFKEESNGGIQTLSY